MGRAMSHAAPCQCFVQIWRTNQWFDAGVAGIGYFALPGAAKFVNEPIVMCCPEFSIANLTGLVTFARATGQVTDIVGKLQST